METLDVNKELSVLKHTDIQLFGKDFLLTWQHRDDDIRAVLATAAILKKLHKQKFSLKVFDTGLGISIFRDHSTRTRFSFASALNALGLGFLDLDEAKSQLSHGETVRETANMISFLAEVVGIRDDMYLGAGDQYQREFGIALDEGFSLDALPQRPVILNLQSDLDHPTQTLADMSELIYYFGSIEALRGKKIAMTWAYSPTYGKPLSVPQGIIALMTRFGMSVQLAYPNGYHLSPDVVAIAQKFAHDSQGKFSITHSMKEAFSEADIVYPKSWAPYEIMLQRTQLQKHNEVHREEQLEKQCLRFNAQYQSWECTENLMKLTKQGKALYQHCLPADISGVTCKRGEVSAFVFERYKKYTYHQASYKPFVIAAMILLCRFSDPYELIRMIIGRGRKRQN